MDPRIALLFEHLDRLIKTAIEKTIEKEYGGVRLLDYVNAGDNSYLDLLAEGFTPREDGLLVYGPYDLESVAGKGSQARNDLSLAIEPIVGDNTDELLGFRLSLRDQSTVESGGLNPMRKPDSAIYNQTSEIFFLELGEFSTLEEANNLFTQTVDVNGRTAIISLVGDKLDEIFPNSTSSIEMALSNKGPVISERIRTSLSRDFAPDYIVKAMEQVDKEQYEQYGELLGEVEVPDTVEAAAVDVVPDNVSQLTNEDKVMQLLDDLKEKYGEFLDSTASEAGDGSGLHFDLTSGNIINGNEIYIESFYLKPEAQGQGIGRKMVNALKKLSDEINVPITLLDKTLESAYSSSFWRNMGFDLDDDTASAFYNYEGDPQSSRFAKESLQFDGGLSDDIEEVNNDFVYEKFKDRQNTADNVIFKEAKNGEVELLVIKRKRGPHRDLFALPGGIVEADLPDEKVIKSVVDPNFVNLHETLFSIDGEMLPVDYEKLEASRVFGIEALREAVEEVGLDPKYIDMTQILPIKYNRYDWDARAASGVNVGGAFIIVKDIESYDIVDGRSTVVDTDVWSPKAADDALAYQWIKLDDVINGTKELAFGHTEFVENALKMSLRYGYFNKSTRTKIVKGTSIYDYDDVKSLNEQSENAIKRNVEIIKGSNAVREQVGQPLIPIEGNNIIDRKNKAMIDSIRQIGKVNVGENVTFTAIDQMKPDFIFIDLLRTAIESGADTIEFTPADIEGDVLETRDPEYRGGDYKDIQLNKDGKRRLTEVVKDFTSRSYESILKRKINQGMQINPVIAEMKKNADKIINSPEFETIINEAFDRLTVVEAGAGDYLFVKHNTEAGLYSYLHPNNSMIQNEGLEAATTDIIEFMKINYPKAGNAMESIRNTNKVFYNNTFPEEIYIPAWEYYKNNSNDMPQAMIDTQKLVRNADGNLSGMVYHGGNGLNAKGRKVFDVLQTYLPATNFGTTAPMKQFENSMNGFLNRVTFENNIEWLEPRNYRDRMLRLNYMYSTSSPFLAASYAVGGSNPGQISDKNQQVFDAIYQILNHKEILDVDNTDLIDMMNRDLREIGLEVIIDTQGNYLKSVTNENTLLIDPGIMQIKFNAEPNAILHTDMPIIRQLNNPNVPTLLQNIIKNAKAENIVQGEVLDNLIGELQRQSAKDSYFIKTAPANENIVELLNKAYQDGPERETIKNYYKRIMDTDVRMSEIIKQIIQGSSEKTYNFSNMHGLLQYNLRPKQAVTPELYDEAVNYIKKVDEYLDDSIEFITPEYFHKTRTTPGHVLFTAQADKFFPYERIQFEDMFEFAATQVDPKTLGSHQSVNDLLYVKNVIEYLDDYPKLKAEFFKDFPMEVGYDYIQKGPKGINIADDLLQDMAIYSNIIISKHNLRYSAKGIGDFRGLDLNPNDLKKQTQDIVYESFNFKEGNKELIHYLNEVNGLTTSTPTPVGNPEKFADISLLQSLSESGIEIVAGTGGGRNRNNFHDVFGIVDPGDKFGTGVPRKTVYDIKSVELDEQALLLLDEINMGITSFNDLDDKSIKAIANFIPIETIMNTEELTDIKKQQYMELYTDLNITDGRFSDINTIDPTPVDGAFLQNFDELRELIAQQSLFGDVSDNTVQNQATKVMEQLFAQVPEEKIASTAARNGLLQTLGNGLDIFDAAVLAPVMIDLLISKTTGVGEATETIGGAVADVAQDIYDPSKTDTVFEKTYGSPEDPGTLAGAVSGTFDIYKEAANPLVEEAKNNPLLASVFTSIKEGAISALDTVKDGFGMNDWIYNVKRDMYVGSKLKEKGYNGKNVAIPSGLVSQLESEYEAGMPQLEDKYGRTLDVADSSNFPKYNPGRR